MFEAALEPPRHLMTRSVARHEMEHLVADEVLGPDFHSHATDCGVASKFRSVASAG